MPRGFLLPLLFLFIPLLLTQQTLAEDPQTTDPDVVLAIQQATLTPHHGPAELQRKLTLHLLLKPGFKAYVEKFGFVFLEPYPISHSELNLTPIHTFYDKFSKSNKKGLKESGTLSTTLEIQRPLPPGSHQLIFELKFQACSETVCYFPQTLKKEVPFVVAETNPSKKSTEKSLGLLEENFSNAKKRGLPYLFIFVFLAGILTSLTPCLLPMLPLTIAVIGKGHSHDAKLRKFLNAMTYVLGIATTYSLLGVIAASSGALFGNVLSNIWVQVTFGIAFVAMGLAQFGLFEFQTPLWLQNRFHKLSHGTGGIYLSGLLSGFIASPCVGPVLVGILTFIAQSQDQVLGFWLMFAYALGLGQLLIVLGVFSSLLYRFPRAPWLMKTSKTLLGFALIASGLFYLSLLWPKPTTASETSATPSASVLGLPWKPYSEQAFQESTREGKPILIDFYADWCLACLELEEKTFSQLQVRETLADFTLLKFNATEESPELETLRKRYQIVGLPTLLFFDAKGTPLTEQTLNEFEAPDLFVKRLKAVKSK